MAQHQWNGEHTWTVGEPITQEKMNSIEGGIAEALEQQSAIDALDSRLDKIDGGSVLTDAKNLKQQVSEAAEKASQALGAANTAQVASSDGQIALSQIQGALARTDGEGNPIDPYNNLATRLAEDQTAINNKISQTNSNVSSIQTNMGLLSEEVRNARSTLKFNGSNATAQNLRAKIDDMDFQITANQGAISSITTSYNSSMTDISGVTHNSLADRLDSMENNTKDVADEVEDARGTYTDLDARLDTDETAIGNLETNKIPYSDIVADLTTNNDNKPLAASQGRELKQTIGGAYSSSNTVATGIANAEQNAKDYTDAKLGSGFDSTNTVAARIDAIDNASTGTIHGLDTRISALETEIDMTSANSRIDLVETEVNNAHRANVNNDTLDNRFDDIENAITTLNGNAQTNGSVLNTVNAQIAAVVNSAPEAFDTLGEIAAWIQNDTSGAAAMQQAISNNTGAISALDTRLTAIDNSTNGRMKVAEDDIDALETALDNTNSGLTQRVGTLEATIGDNTSGLVKDVADNTQAVVNINTAISHTASGNDPGGLTQRITALESEPKSATVVIDNTHITYNEGVPTSIGETPSEDKDYLLQGAAPDDKYYYWKYLGTAPNGTWNLISGGGSGSGNTSGMDLTEQEYEDLDEYAENTDYYVTRSDGVHHYRYIPDSITGETLVEIEIGLATNYNIGIGTVTENDVDNTYLYLYKFAPNEDSTINSDTTLPLVNRGTLVNRVKLPATGGGAYEYIRVQAASGQKTVFTAIDGNNISIPLSLEAFKRDQMGYVASTFIVSMQYRERNASTWSTYAPAAREISVTNTGPTSFTTVDISSLLVLNKIMEIKVTVADKNNTKLANSSITFSISKVALNLTSTFDQSVPCTTNTIAFNYSYTGSGLNKTLYIYLDDMTTPITTRNLGTGIGNGQYNIDMSEYSAGTHNLKVYYETEDHDSSNILNYFIMYVPTTETLTHPIVGISIEDTTILEGDVLTVYYSTYTQNAEYTESVTFELFEGDSTEPYTSKVAQNIENNQYEPILFLDYPVPAEGVNSITVTIRATAANTNQESYSVEQEITVNRYTDTEINFDPVESNLIYEFDPVMHTNNDTNRTSFTYSPNSGTIYTTTLNDFNWTSNGYLGDEALTFNGDAKMIIDVPILTTNVAGTDASDTPTSRGRTVEFEYEVNSVTDINKPIISYFNNSNIVVGTDTSTKTGVGFEITPQNCYLISESKSIVTDKKGFIHNEDDIAAAYLSEGSRLRVSFVIESVGTHTTGAGNNAQTVNIYINGQYANSCPYDGNSELFTIPADANCKITIGNDSSILKLYDVRVYNRGLTELEILQNYMTAPLLRRDKLARIRENDLLTANQKEIDYYKARQHYNCLLITGNLSPAKSEKVSSGLIFTQPNSESEGGYDVKFECMDTFPDGSYTSQNAVQGTSSVKFPVKNYKVYLTSGYQLDEENKPKAVKYKYALEPGRVKESTFCWKGDYMSSDHANTFNANWADALESRIDGASHVQNSVYGFRCLLFYRTDDDENTPIVLIGDGTLNNDKGNTKTFQLEDSSDEEGSNDTRSQKWEFKNNTETPCLFQSDNLISLVNGEEDYTAATNAFESTYPDEGDLEDANVRPNYNHLQILLSWVLRRANYWDETDTSTRAAKKAIFKNEFSRHFNMDHMLLYYLFCEFTAMTDNRAKNMFIRCDTVRDEEVQDTNGVTLFSGNAVSTNPNWYNYITGNNAYKAAHYADIDWENSTFGVWTPILYDLDSCYGVENSGYLQVPYYANWNYRDVADTKYLFNGYGSILWLMFEDSFADEIRAMAQTIYANGSNGEPGLNYNSFYKYHITDNALKFPPVIINQDMNKKYLNPWINGLPDPEDSTKTIYNAQYKYLQRGSRTDQKVGFIERRSRMLYSKYLTTQFIANEASVNFRCGNAGAKDPITLIAGTACYPAIQFSDTSSQTVTTEQQYANTGDSVSFTPGEDGMGFSDTVYIRGASMLTGITGIGGYMPYEINLSGGRNLKQLTLGSPTVINTQVSSSALSGLDACSILEELNIENFNGSSFTTLNLTSNRLLKHLYATGANNLGTCSFANGGIIENIELGTGLTNLTIRNQGRIQTLKFGGSNTVLANNVSKINTIFVEGISTAAMQVVQDVFKLRLYALKDQIKNGRTTGEAVALGGGVRISGLNMTLTCRDSNGTILDEYDLLDLLINKEVMRGKGLAHDGTLSSSAYPYLSGTLTINYGQSSKIATLRSMYPNLTIVENNTITSYTIVYKYDSYLDNDNNLVSGSIIRDDIIVDEGSRIPDIYATGLIEQPTRTPTVRNTFSFGARNQAGYITNSGWKAVGASSYYTTMPMAEQGLIVETYFTTAVRRYPVKWYLTEEDYNNNEPVATSSSQVVYGGGESLEAPTVKDIHNAGKNTVKVEFAGNNVTYKIFTGWEKLPINIAPTASDEAYNIFGTWKTVTTTFSALFPEYGENEEVPDPTPEQLLVLSRMNEQQRSNCPGVSKIVSSAHMTYTMGNDSKETGIDLINNAYGNSLGYDVLRFDLGTAAAATNIQPLSSTNDAFTIMIDYTFNANATYATGINQAILMSCYYQNSAQNVVTGFVLYNNLNSSLNTTGPRIGFGNMFNESMYSKPVGTVGSRNILVLRHPAGSSKLYIYSGLSGNSVINSSYDDALEIEWNNSTSNAYINFGQLTNDTSLEYYNLKQVSTTASGTIYKAKYWNKDLGIGECKRLAAWPHESMTVAISKIKSTQTTGEQRDVAGVMVPTIGLTTITTSNHGYITHDNSSWGASNYNTICNNRIFNGLPIELQSILSRPMIRYLNVTSTSDGSGGYSYALGNLSSVPAYIYMPSAYNMSSSATNYITEDNAEYETAPFEWIVNTNVATYNYNSSNTWTRDTSDTSQYMNMRFPIKPLNSSIRVFREVSNSFSNSTTTTIMDEIAKLANNVLEGDIFIDISGNAYIYVSNSDIMNLGAQMQPESGIFATNGNGGWVASRGYWLRSLMVPDQWTGTIRSTFVNKTGTVYTVYNSNNTPDASGLSINYSMTI